MLNAALEYAAKGQAVFPLRPGGKEPLTPNGMKDATTDYAKIREWWESAPDANIGLPCQGFDVLDVDDGGDKTLAAYPDLPDTACVKTPTGGRHYYFKPCKDMANSVKFLPGLDYRANGKGYVVAPPSVNGNGKWEWIKKVKLAEPPEWLKNANKKKERLVLAPEIKEGERNQTLFDWGVRLRRFMGCSEIEVLAALRGINQSRGNPPLEDHYIVDMARRVAEYDTYGVPENSTNTDARSGWIGDFETHDIKRGVESGICVIDENTVTGGYPSGQFTVVQAASGVGKSTMMLKSVLHQLKQGHTVFYVTLADLEGPDIFDKLVQMETGWYGGKEPDYEPMRSKWHEVREWVKKANLWVHDITQHRELRDVHEMAKFIQGNHQGASNIFIDYAQKLRAKGVKGIHEVSEVCADALSWLAKDISVPLIVASQESLADDGTVTTKGGRVWFEEAGLVLRVSRFSDKDKSKLEHPLNEIKGIGMWEITKNRFGEDLIKVYAQFDRTHATWVRL